MDHAEYLRRLLEVSMRARANGATPADIAEAFANDPDVAEIARAFEVNVPSTMADLVALHGAVANAQEGISQERIEAQERVGEHSGVSNFARSGAQGATLGAADEAAGLGFGGIARGILGIMSGQNPATSFGREMAAAAPEIEASRERVRDLRLANPAAAAMGEIAGGILVPTGAAAATSRTGAAAAAAAGGGLAGGLFALDAEDPSPGSVGRGAAMGILLGGTAGAVGPSVGRAVSRGREHVRAVFSNAGRSRHLGMALREIAGIGDETLDDAMLAAERATQRVREETYQSFDEDFSEVNDPALRSLLAEDRTRTIVRSVAREVAAGDRAPSFRELQLIRSKMRKGGAKSPEIEAHADLLNQEMQRVIPGLKDADRRYAQALAQEEAFEIGRKLASTGKSSALIQRAVRQATTPEEVLNIQRGIMHEWSRKLMLRDQADTSLFNAMIDAGPEFVDNIRAAFPTEAQADRFLLLARSERGRRGRVVFLQRALKVAGVGAAAALGLHRAASRGGEGE